MKKALMVFAKYPEPGKVKSRLYPDFSYEQAAAFYETMIEDLVSNLSCADSQDVLLYYTPADSVAYFDRYSRENVLLRKQSEGNLGQRLLNAFAETFQSDYEKILVMGSDCLTISHADINRYYDFLDSYDGVIGPTEDGGYYVLGICKMHEPLFSNVPWSTENVFAETKNRIIELGLKFRYLETKYDLDSMNDVEKFFSEYHNKNKETGFRNSIKFLRSFLKTQETP